MRERGRRHRRSSSELGASILCVAATVWLVPSAATACGVSAADGVSACDLAEHADEARPRWRIGGSSVATSTSLRFAGSWVASESRYGVLGALSYSPSSRLTLNGALGATLGGHLETMTGTYAFSAGPTGAIGASWRAVARRRAFVVMTSLLSFASAETRPSGTLDPAVRYTAFDLRVGGLAGATFFDRVSPYAAGRIFGGPIFWRYQGARVTGTDTHHYQLGAGLAVLLIRRLDLYAEGVPFGERAIAVGASAAF